MSNSTDLTIQVVESHIQSERFFYDEQLTICVLTLIGGYKVVGQSYIFNSENYDKVEGMQRAKNDAIKNVFELVAFKIKTQSVNL